LTLANRVPGGVVELAGDPQALLGDASARLLFARALGPGRAVERLS